MKVTLLAFTELATQNTDALLPWDSESSSADFLAELSGRSCYLSWNRPSPATRSNVDYLAHILEIGHESILEHASATFYVTGVSRALLLELERHRHLSFSVVSQRYVDHSDASHVIPPVFRDDPQAIDMIENTHDRSLEVYQNLVSRAEKNGASRKEARGAARTVLPEGTETSIVLSANHRAFRYVIKLRNSPHADAEIREFAKALLVELKKIAPNTYSDMDV